MDANLDGRRFALRPVLAQLPECREVGDLLSDLPIVLSISALWKPRQND